LGASVFCILGSTGLLWAESPPTADPAPPPTFRGPSDIRQFLESELTLATEPPPDISPDLGPLPAIDEMSLPTWQPSPNPNPTATGVFNPDPGAYSGEAPVPQWNPPLLIDLPDYGLEPLPDDLQLPRENTTLTPRKLAKFKNRDSFLEEGLPANTERAPSRWNIPYQVRDRYENRQTAETPFQDNLPWLWHPYRQSLLKGDVPILGEDVFLRLAVTNFTEFESRRLPVPSGISTANPSSSEFFGNGDIYTVQQNFLFTLDFFQGETEVFKPVVWQLRLQPVYNINYTETRETNILQPNPLGSASSGGGGNLNFNPDGSTGPGDIFDFLNGNLDVAGDRSGTAFTSRLRDKWALQQGWFELHLLDLTDNYDFISSRFGYQQFNSDFRGLVFNDTNLGYRIFGNAENNLWQYNFIYFDAREKDTNSELNTFDNRNQDIFVANLYRQDFIVPGYTVSLSGHFNFDNGRTHFDRNGFLARPAPIGTVGEHDVRAYYAGFAGEGKIGRVNISHSFYQAFGTDTLNGIEGQETEINAQQAHIELSYDRDWIRYKAAFFYASGDSDTTDGKANGFDSITDNPNLFGGPFSYWVRQGFNLGGTAVNLKQRNSLIPNLRTSKFEGQSNFVNPGVFIWGVGTDLELTPEMRLFLNANYIRFVDTAPIKQALFTNQARHDVGYDLSIGVIARPLLTDNVIITSGFAAFVPEQGYRDIYDQNRLPIAGYDDSYPAADPDFLYSAFVSLTLTW
jgi:hypothetical protein